MPVTISRRAALIAAAAVPLSACTTDGSDSAAAPADPDRIVRGRAGDEERELIARYRATIETHPRLEPELAAFIARHERHLEEILATTPADAADDQGSPPAAQDVTGDDVPGVRAEAITALREAEAAHAAARIEDSMASYDYELARVFASVAACEAAHNQLLGEVA